MKKAIYSFSPSYRDSRSGSVIRWELAQPGLPYSTLVFDLELVSIVKPEVKAEPAGELKEDVAVGAENK